MAVKQRSRSTGFAKGECGDLCWKLDSDYAEAETGSQGQGGGAKSGGAITACTGYDLARALSGRSRIPDCIRCWL